MYVSDISQNTLGSLLYSFWKEMLVKVCVGALHVI